MMAHEASTTSSQGMRMGCALSTFSCAPRRGDAMSWLVRGGGCFLLGFLLLLACFPAHGAEETIFVVESYNAEMKWDASYKEGLQEVLGKKYKLEYFQMDTKRL